MNRISTFFRIFVMSITSTSGILRLMLAAGFFYTPLQTIYGSVPPCGVVNAPTARRVIDSGKGRTVFYSCQSNKFLRDMSIREKCSAGQVAPGSNRVAHDTSNTPDPKRRTVVSYKKFLAECEARNAACALAAERDKEAAKWKSCFRTAMEIVKIVNEGNKLIHRCYKDILSITAGGAL